MESDSLSRIIECPADVFQLVIAVLPLPDLCRLRSVCKEWNEIITTRAFHENGQLKFNKVELLAICTVDSNLEFQAYDVEAEKWHSFDLSFLPDDGDGGLRVVDFQGSLASIVHTTQRVISNHYMPFSLPPTVRDMDRPLYVCNPLTKRWAQLPSPPTTSKDFNISPSGLVIVRTYCCRKMGHYKVFVVSAGRASPDRLNWTLNRPVVKEFDSYSQEWIVYSQTCHLFRWQELTGVGVLPCNNGNGASLFILLDSDNPHEREVYALLFDEDKGTSAFMKIGAALPSNLLKPTMVCSERAPRPLLVSAVGDRDRATGIEIWELGNQLSEWRNLAALPSDLFICFKSLYRETLLQSRYREFTGEPTTVVAVPYKHLVYIHDESTMSWTIAYDTLKRSWLWLSRKLPSEINATLFPHPNSVSRLSGVRGCSFEPSLANVVYTLGFN